MNKYHKTVLLNEVINLLKIKRDAKYIDATLGGGGHSISIIQKGGRVLGIDSDEQAIEYINNTLKETYARNSLKVVKGNFRNIAKIARNNNFTPVSGILFDLGVSGHQIDHDNRGFSFQRENILDMRMDMSLNVQAKDLLNALTQKELYELFYKYGQDKFSYQIAKKIIIFRAVKPIETTIDFMKIIDKAIPLNIKKVEIYARLFQALRIAVNDELENIKIALRDSLDLLSVNGRIAVISFHSLEDRIVKQRFLAWEKAGIGTILTKKPVTPDKEEIEVNNRSRSAKLRVFEKIYKL